MEAIDSRMIEHEGTTCVVTLYADDETSITDYEDDAYDAAAREAWNNGEWRFVGVHVRTVKGQASVWSVEFGNIAGITIDMGKIIEDGYVSDLLADIK